jgi:hypothetical protein
MKKTVVGVFLFVAIHGVSVAALGQTSDAQRLFEQAVGEIEQRDFAAACPHFEESFNLDGNAGTLLSLANCLNDAGKIASAVLRYEQFIKLIPTLDDKPREKAEVFREEVSKTLETLKEKVPRLKLALPKDAPEGLVVSLDGAELPASTLGQLLTVDPGNHKLAVDAPGRKRVEWDVVLQERQTLEERIRIPEAPLSIPPPNIPPPSAEPPKAPRTKSVVASLLGASMSVPVKPKTITISHTRYTQWNVRQVIVVASGSIAGAGLLAWAIPGVFALSKKRDVDAHCSNNVCETLASTQSARETRKYLGYASGGLILGGVGVAGLATMGMAYLVNRKLNTTKPRVEAGVLKLDSTGAMFGLKGEF